MKPKFRTASGRSRITIYARDWDLIRTAAALTNKKPEDILETLLTAKPVGDYHFCSDGQSEEKGKQADRRLRQLEGKKPV